MISTETLPALPSRVLDVDALHSPSKLSLVESCGRHGHYVTLSHVWGQQRIITTTATNIREQMQSIRLETLSQTFKIAISIVRKLNIRYIWIDSLCIIQDDPKDWAVEAAKMGGYYLNSLFNIAAVSAYDGYTGRFMRYMPLKITPCPITVRFSASAQNTDGFQRPTLWQRAWVLQERLLSPRLLLFSEMQMSWLCRTEEASERVPEGTSRFIDLKHSDKAFRSAILGFTSLINLYNSWYDLVMLYGKCSLTVKSDIFPAISGIARAIGRATGDEYYAGHWRNDLHRGLLWTAPDSTASHVDLREHRAPSWSWASL
ncbi:HET-domain-containing protein, partial [Zopfia rhizophila CBS 207.26]